MVLEIKNLKKNYGAKEALKGVSLSLTPGIYGLLGPNGAGKSTLIGILTCNIKASSGAISLDGKEIVSMGEEYRKLVGYMPQQQALYPSFTAEAFLDYIAALKGMAKDEAKKKIPEILEAVDLNGYADKKIKTFSGGMKQRLLLAQAILDEPAILILDEPTAGLDPKQRISVRNLISRIAKDKIVLIATHVVSDVEFIAKELVLLNDGTVLKMGEKKNILESVQGHVFEVELFPEQYAGINDDWRIGSVSQIKDKVYVRVIVDKPNFTRKAEEVRPSLEDVYLYYFGGL